MTKGRKPTRAEIARVARIYRTIKDASRALGIGEVTFKELCYQHGIETPYDREKRKHKEWSEWHGGPY